MRPQPGHIPVPVGTACVSRVKVFSVKYKFAVEPADVSCTDEPWMLPELSGELSGQAGRKRTLRRAARKWWTLALSFLVHCMLVVPLCSMTTARVPGAQKVMQVRLVEPAGGGDGLGTGLETPGTGEEGSRPAEEMVSPPQPAPPPPERKEPAVERPKTHPAVPVKKIQPRKRPVRTKVPVEDKEEVRPPGNKPAEQAPSEHAEGAAVGMETGTGMASGAGAQSSGQPGGRGGSGTHADGPVEVAFGAAGGPRFLHRVMPSYPPFARKQEREGTVLLRVTISAEGHVLNVEILQKAGSGFDEAAVKAVRESVFAPARKDGKAVSCKAVLPIRFELTNPD